MVFFHALPRRSVNVHPEMTHDAPSEAELIKRRIEAAKRVRLRRLMLKMGLAAARRLWRRTNNLRQPRRVLVSNGNRTEPN